ncbi:MAG: hypothetical protein GY758_27880 [Fuerstiella sp.]|nr:hypothetical protein [Fuerstiella sp.]MCP4509465.1 hypothetical protein [Fuerstiella sp.]MDG2130543.1 hypothetical protein [Fuerstiella sp.]
MKRIVLTLAVLTALCFAVTGTLGLSIGDPGSSNPQIQTRVSIHMLVGMGTLSFAMLVHAITLTYFMGTGRWLEETSNAYGLDESLYKTNQRIKYRVVWGMTLCFALLITTGALGALADPATPMSLDGTLGLKGSQFHFFTAITTVIINLLTYFSEFVAISRNTTIVESVLAEVGRIRTERGLPT